MRDLHLWKTQCFDLNYDQQAAGTRHLASRNATSTAVDPKT